jgi:PAS domain S-box-containing protein
VKETDYKTRFEECDDKFNTVFELTSAASKIINSDLTILKVNKALTELLGYNAEEIQGTKILQYACPEYKQHWHDLQEALWARKLPFFKLDACLFRKDGSIAWVNVTTILFKDKEVTYGFTVLDDITAKKDFEESERQLKAALAKSYNVQDELKQNKEDLARILDTMAEGVGIIDTTGKLTYANQMAQKILGLKESEIKERTFDDPKWQNLRLDGSPLPPEEHPMAIMMRTGKQLFDHEIGVQPPVGDLMYISINAAPIYDANGNLVGGMGTFMDVTARRKIIQEKDEFISVASHELRTPITSLKASLQLLQKIKDNPATSMMPVLIDQANKSLNKVSALIADLLNASKFTEGQLQLNKTYFKLSKLIDDCCDHIRIAGEFEIIINGDLELEVYADANRIEQVINNFVNNAVKYAPESKTILINIAKEGNKARVSVTDKGKGIPSAKQKNLFERYFRVATSGIQYSGLGLGLYINAEIVKRHEGEIGVNSSINQGSTFWFTLPLTTPA